VAVLLVGHVIGMSIEPGTPPGHTRLRMRCAGVATDERRPVLVAAMVIACTGAGSVVLLGAAAVLLDVGMIGNQILSLRKIYQLRRDARARLNTVYMGSAFIGGAIGSVVAGHLHGTYGWTGDTIFGAALGGLAFVLWAWSRLRAHFVWPSRS
jgi:cyanate permease